MSLTALPKAQRVISTPVRSSGSTGLLLTLLFLTACDAGPGEESQDAPEVAESVKTPTDVEPAFDYPGGWKDDTSCVDICGVTPGSPVERPPAVVCFNPNDEECKSKTGDNDYDFLMLSQHWLPTMCAGLEAGYDTTVTHQAGTRCREGAPSRLTIHGLWQNYTAGFPQCCGEPLPLDPEKVQAWSPELRDRLDADWLDPTTSGFDDAICEIYNHEWQKHGTCNGPQTDGGAQSYFVAGLDLADGIAEATQTIDGWAGGSVARSEIAALYPKSAQIMCDAAQPEHLIEIHTCWSRDHQPIDCPPARGFGHLAPCGENVGLPRAP